MIAPATPHPWSEESLFCKAVLYIQRMEDHPAEDWQYGLWSALSLEFLSRAALAHISPVLLADKRNWHNLVYALGKKPRSRKFSPVSLSTREVYQRLKELIPSFAEVADFCATHTRRRNSELHSGELAFESLDTSTWLPYFYLACDILVKSINRQLTELVSDSSAAENMINSLRDAAAKSIKKDIRAHETVWSNKDAKEQLKLSLQATTWATRHEGHRVSCPACNSSAILKGTPSGPVTTELRADNVVERQSRLPSSFECIACGLRIIGFSKLSACGLGNTFTATTTYTPADYFRLYTEDELEDARMEPPEFELDFNEY